MKKEHADILELLQSYLEQNPELRFGQAIFNLGINEFQKTADPDRYILRDIYNDADADIVSRIKDRLLIWREQMRIVNNKYSEMVKSDKSKHNIAVAAIKRHTIKPYDFKWTNFYESNADFYTLYPNIFPNLFDDELIVCTTVIDAENFSILTTRRLFTNENGVLQFAAIEEANHKTHGLFKSIAANSFTFGYIERKDKSELKYFIETGYASMVMVYGVRTLIQTQQKTNVEVEK